MVGSHLCWSYSGTAERRAVLREYFIEGYRRRERLFYFGREGSEDTLANYLADECDVDSLLASGGLVTALADDVYVTGGPLDRDSAFKRYVALADSALADGYTGVRAFADVGKLVSTCFSLAEWLDYERFAEMVCSTLPLIVLCGYDLDDCTPETYVWAQTVHGGSRCPDHPSHVHLRRQEGGVLVLEGELDSESAQHVEGLLVASISARPGLVVDVSRLSFVDGAGIHALATALRSSVAAQINGASTIFRKLWALLGNDPLRAHGTVSAARLVAGGGVHD